MRLLLASAAITLFALSPASAMCGGSQHAGSQAMCGAPAASKQMSEWPEAKVQQSQKQSGMGMCGCCKNMAMMDSTKSDDPHKDMDMK